MYTKGVLGLAGLVLMATSLSGCVGQMLLDAAAQASLDSETPESTGRAPANYRGKTCPELALDREQGLNLIKYYRGEDQGDREYLAKQSRWIVSSVEQVEREQGCLAGTTFNQAFEIEYAKKHPESTSQVNVQASAIAAPSGSVTRSSVVATSSVAAPPVPVSAALDTTPSTFLQPSEAPAARGQLGVYASPVTPTVVESFGLPGTNGVLVLGPVPGSNAERDGILAGDIILSIDGKPVNTPSELTAISNQMLPGSKVPLRVWRYRAAIDVSVEISKAGGQ